MNFRPVFEKKNPHEAQYELIEKYMVPLNRMITLRPDQTIREAISIILGNRISGAPVLDQQRRLVAHHGQFLDSAFIDRTSGRNAAGFQERTFGRHRDRFSNGPQLQGHVNAQSSSHRQQDPGANGLLEAR